MRVSLNWIKKFVDINGIDHKEIADKLTMSGLEVEGIEVVKAPKGVVVGKVIEKGKHPNADKLSVCKVFDGTEYYQVVCGASNVEAGQTIPFAKIGAELPNGMKLKEAKLRGVESRGMICSAAELGLEEESDGILVLPDSYVAGKDINEYIEIEDVVLEINITPNRADCLSILGVAREIAVLFGRDVKNYSFVVEEDEEQAKDLRFIKILNKIDCPAYYGRIIKGVKLGESPDWIKTRLRKVGIRPINNIVDITNYVMIEYGQPLHAFDLRMVEDGIIVRNAEDGEKIITLDGKERILNSNMLVIADSKKVLAIAGIMGGEYSGIQNDTVDVFLECAYFRPESIRLTSRRLGLKTDSSYRYERGIDRGSTYKMIDYAASLMAEISGGRVLKGILNDGIDEFKNTVVEFSTAKINSLLGVTLVEDSMIKILKDLGFEIVKNGDGYIATVPSYRQDISLWQDLAEEVARIYGYDKIPVTVPKIYASSKPSDKLQSKIRQIKDILVTMGYNEVINYSFMGKEFLSKFLDDRFIFIKNPLSQDMDTMRSAVFPGVIKSIITNYRSGFKHQKLFEIANVHEVDSSNILPKEKCKVCFAVLGSYFKSNWIGKVEADNFYYLKGVAEQVLKLFTDNYDFVRSNEKFFHTGKSADILVNGVKIGYIGELHPEYYDYLDIDEKLYIAEIDLSLLMEKGDKGLPHYRKISQYPYVYKDISLIVDRKTEAKLIYNSIKVFSDLIKDVELFDIYSGEKIGEDKISMTFRIYFNDLNKTLTDEETNKIVGSIIDDLSKRYGATLR